MTQRFNFVQPGDYRAKRQRQYPSVGDQLDAIWQILAQLRADGINLGPSDAMLDRVLGVKQRNPRP